jgi:hypothetical protein
MAQVEALESVIDTRGLESLSDEELEALEAWHDEGEPERWEAWVAAWVASRPPQVVTLSEPEEDSPLTEEPEEAPEPQPLALGSEAVKEESPVTAPDVLRSCDYVPRSPWAGPPVERDESEEVTFRLEPLERVYGVRPPRRRRRRSRRP